VHLSTTTLQEVVPSQATHATGGSTLQMPRHHHPPLPTAPNRNNRLTHPSHAIAEAPTLPLAAVSVAEWSGWDPRSCLSMPTCGVGCRGMEVHVAVSVGTTVCPDVRLPARSSASHNGNGRPRRPDEGSYCYRWARRAARHRDALIWFRPAPAGIALRRLSAVVARSVRFDESETGAQGSPLHT
jgi:hypothetical protein